MGCDIWSLGFQRTGRTTNKREWRKIAVVILASLFGVFSEFFIKLVNDNFDIFFLMTTKSA